MIQIASNLEDEKESEDKANLQGKQEQIAKVAAAAQPARTESHNAHDVRTGLKVFQL